MREPWSSWMREISSQVTLFIIVVTFARSSSSNSPSSKVSSISTSLTSSWSLRVFIYPECCLVQPIYKSIQHSTLVGSMHGGCVELPMYYVWYYQIFLHDGALSWSMPMGSLDLTIFLFWCYLASWESVIWGGMMEW
jgi:hypothetical protein